jgi:hypothetical protein
MTFLFPDRHLCRVKVVAPAFGNRRSNTDCVPYTVQIISPTLPVPLFLLTKIPAFLCNHIFRRSNLARPALTEIFCKCDCFINWHFIPTFLLVRLISSFCLWIFKSMTFLVLEYLHFPVRSGITCWRNRQWLVCQLANSKDINIRSLIYHNNVSLKGT